MMPELPYRVHRPTGGIAHRARTSRDPAWLLTGCGTILAAHKARPAPPGLPNCPRPGCNPDKPRKPPKEGAR
jgi:hypothetical protein